MVKALKQNDVIYYNLYQALSNHVCPVCQCIAEATGRFLDNLMYEFVNDLRTRDRLRETKGFCREHSWALQRMGDPLGHSIIYADLIDSFLSTLDKKEVVAKRRKIPFAMSKGGECPVCLEEEEMENRYIYGLLASLKHEDFREKYRSSVGLCLPHFNLVSRQVSDKEVEALLHEVEINSLSKLSAELKEFIRKSDYRYARELPGEERDAWIRAVELWVGSLDLKKQSQSSFKNKEKS